MKFSYNWIRELVTASTVARRARAPDHHEDRRVRRRGTRRRALWPSCVGRAWSSRRADRGQPQRQGGRRTGRYGAKTVVCGAPNCRPGMLTAYVPASALEGDRIGRGERRHARQRRRTRHQSRPRGHRRTATPKRARCWRRTDRSSKSTTSPSRTGPISGAITAWRAKWPPSPARALRDPVDLDLLPQRAAAVQVRHRRFRPLPAIQRAGVRKRHRRPSPLWLQYRLEAIGLNPINNIVDVTNLRHGGAGAADARLRRGQAARRHDLRPPRARRRDRSSR